MNSFPNLPQSNNCITNNNSSAIKSKKKIQYLHTFHQWFDCYLIITPKKNKRFSNFFLLLQRIRKYERVVFVLEWRQNENCFSSGVIFFFYKNMKNQKKYELIFKHRLFLIPTVEHTMFVWLPSETIYFKFNFDVLRFGCCSIFSPLSINGQILFGCRKKSIEIIFTKKRRIISTKSDRI